MSLLLTSFEKDVLRTICDSENNIFDRFNDHDQRDEEGLPERSEFFYDALLSLECTLNPPLIEEIEGSCGRYLLTQRGWAVVKSDDSEEIKSAPSECETLRAQNTELRKLLADACSLYEQGARSVEGKEEVKTRNIRAAKATIARIGAALDEGDCS